MTEDLGAAQLRAQRVLPTIAHVVLLGVVFLMIRDVPTAAASFLPWAAVVVLIMLARTILWGRLAGASPRTISLVVRSTMLVLGLAWGAGTALLTRVAPPVIISLMLLGLAGLLAGALTTLMSDRWAFTIYAVALFLPIAVTLAVWGDREMRTFEIVLLAIYVIFTNRLHAQAHTMLLQRLRTERQLASAQAIAHVGSWEWDIETNIVTWSDEMRRIFGLPLDAPASFAGFLERVHPDDRARIQAVVAASVAERRATEYDWRTIRPDGEERLIHTRNMLVTDASGRVIRMLGTALDVTERTRAEESQRTLLHQLQASIAEVKVLKGILPICSSCKRIRSTDGKWEAVESYVRAHSHAEFSHGLCPDCAARDWGAGAQV